MVGRVVLLLYANKIYSVSAGVLISEQEGKGRDEKTTKRYKGSVIYTLS